MRKIPLAENRDWAERARQQMMGGQPKGVVKGLGITRGTTIPGRIWWFSSHWKWKKERRQRGPQAACLKTGGMVCCLLIKVTKDRSPPGHQLICEIGPRQPLRSLVIVWTKRTQLRDNEVPESPTWQKKERLQKLLPMKEQNGMNVKPRSNWCPQKYSLRQGCPSVVPRGRGRERRENT